MNNTKNILEKIKLNGVLEDIIAKSTGEHVTVTYDGVEKTLAAALGEILTALKDLPTGENVDGKISAAIDELIGGAPETYDTLKELADYISEHEDVADTLSAAIGGKVDKEEGKGLSTEDFTTALKEKLDGLRGVRYGTEIPADMKDGELFIRVVSQ